MKTGRRWTAALALLLGIATSAHAQEAVPLRDVHAVCSRAHPGYEIAAQTGGGDQIAMILKREKDNILCIAEWDVQLRDYVLTVDNTNAVYDGDKVPGLQLESGGDSLFISCWDEQGNVIHLHSTKQGGVWGAVDTAHYEPYSIGEARVSTTTAYVHDGVLQYWGYTEDENGNLLAEHEKAPIPVSAAFERSMLLDQFDLNAFDVNPIYGLHKTGRREGMMDGLLPVDAGEILCIDLQAEHLLALVSGADERRCLYIAKRSAQGYEGVYRTKALPEDVGMDAYHTGDGEMILGRHGGSVQYGFAYENGAWRLDWIHAQEDMLIGPDYVYDEADRSVGIGRNDGVVYGAHPWQNVLTMDFETLPETIEEAAGALVQDGYALVHNPDPKDRLHLRAEPKRSAKSLGKFYNRTPVRVLGREGEWAHVQIGTGSAVLTGYMMTEYLAFDEGEKARLACAFPQKSLRPAYGEGVQIMRVPGGRAGSDAEGLYTGQRHDFIIGVVEDEWYIVLRSDGSAGYIRQNLFYDGNG